MPYSQNCNFYAACRGGPSPLFVQACMRCTCVAKKIHSPFQWTNKNEFIRWPNEFCILQKLDQKSQTHRLQCTIQMNGYLVKNMHMPMKIAKNSCKNMSLKKYLFQLKREFMVVAFVNWGLHWSYFSSSWSTKMQWNILI